MIGTGGYVCWPLLSAAAKLGIPTALHESNAIPGKAVRMLADKVDRIYVNFASTMDYFPDKSKVLFVGNPMMKKSTAKIPENIREILSIPEGTEKIVLSFGGSLGAMRLNSEIIALMKNFTSHHREVSIFTPREAVRMKKRLPLSGRRGFRSFRICASRNISTICLTGSGSRMRSSAARAR